MALVLLCTAVFLDSMDLSLMGVALPSVQRELSLSEGTLQWLVSGYAVAYGGFLLLGGSLFSDGALLVVTRIVKGLAAALTAPAALSLITTTFTEQAQRTRALGVYSLAGATGYTGGLVLSGLLTDVSWRLVFFLPSLNIAAVQIGAGVGVAVLATLLTTPGLTGYRLAFLAAGCFSGIGALVAALGIRATNSTRQPAPTQS